MRFFWYKEDCLLMENFDGILRGTHFIYSSIMKPTEFELLWYWWVLLNLVFLISLFYRALIAVLLHCNVFIQRVICDRLVEVLFDYEGYSFANVSEVYAIVKCISRRQIRLSFFCVMKAVHLSWSSCLFVIFDYYKLFLSIAHHPK